MPLSAEDREALVRKITDIETTYAANRSFVYHQGAELKKTWAYRKSGGVCYAMSVDWLRRRLWNVYNPTATAKRNFDAPKYANSKKKRVALTVKHGKLQDVYAKQQKVNNHSPTNTILAKMVQSGLTSSGLDRLQATHIDNVAGYTMSETAWATTANSIIRQGAPNTHYAFRQKLQSVLNDHVRNRLSPNAPAVGLLFSMNGEGGHAVALFLEPTREIFFDPNLGEYLFPVPAEEHRETNFVSGVWHDIYHRFFEMDQLTFTRIEYVPPVADDDDD